jgi:hypothetical protein
VNTVYMFVYTKHLLWSRVSCVQCGWRFPWSYPVKSYPAYEKLFIFWREYVTWVYSSCDWLDWLRRCTICRINTTHAHKPFILRTQHTICTGYILVDSGGLMSPWVPTPMFIKLITFYIIIFYTGYITHMYIYSKYTGYILVVSGSKPIKTMDNINFNIIWEKVTVCNFLGEVSLDH